MFPNSQRSVERVHEGASTHVYRVRRNDETFYLRVLPEEGASFTPEILVHKILTAKEVKVPEIVYFEHYNLQLQRSVMITTEIRGRAIGHGIDLTIMRDALKSAGRDLAVINSVSVKHFGWIQRANPASIALRAEFPSSEEWVHQDVDEHVTSLQHAHVLSTTEVIAVKEIMHCHALLLKVEHAYLAHGDFDVTHIYHQNGTYSGIIDFGEIRGTNQLYDLGHFNIENSGGLQFLLEGYAERLPLPPDHLQRIHLSGLLIVLRRIGRRQGRYPGALYQPDIDAVKRLIKVLHK